MGVHISIHPFLPLADRLLTSGSHAVHVLTHKPSPLSLRPPIYTFTTGKQHPRSPAECLKRDVNTLDSAGSSTCSKDTQFGACERQEFATTSSEPIFVRRMQHILLPMSTRSNCNTAMPPGAAPQSIGENQSLKPSISR